MADRGSSLDSEFEEFVDSQRGPCCSVAHLDADVRDFLVRKVNAAREVDQVPPWTQLARFLKSKEHPIHERSLRHHFMNHDV
jgi:hypothetical protein